MRILRRIGRGWFKEADYAANPLFKAVLESEAYRAFIRE
jgi:hypothetical protein